jgi:hypothetical protein
VVLRPVSLRHRLSPRRWRPRILDAPGGWRLMWLGTAWTRARSLRQLLLLHSCFISTKPGPLPVHLAQCASASVRQGGGPLRTERSGVFPGDQLVAGPHSRGVNSGYLQTQLAAQHAC